MFGKRESEDVIKLKEYLTSIQYNQINSALQHYSLACSNLITPAFKGDKKLIEEIIKVIAINNTDKPFHEQFDFAHQLYIDMEIESRSDKYSFLNDLNVCLASPVIAENFTSIKDIYLLFENKRIVNGILDNITKNNFDENQIKLLTSYLKQARKYYADERAFYSDFISILNEDITEETLNNYLLEAKMNTGIYDDEIIGKLSNQIIPLEDKIKKLSKELILVTERNKELQENVTSLENQISELDASNEKLRKSNKELKRDYKELLKEIKRLLKEVPADIERLKNNQISNDNIDPKYQPLRAMANKTVLNDTESSQEKLFDITENIERFDKTVLKVTLPAKDLIHSLQELKKGSLTAPLTDLAIAEGGPTENKPHIIKTEKLKERTGSYWLSKPFFSDLMEVQFTFLTILSNGSVSEDDIYHKHGVRPVVRFYSLKDILKNATNSYQDNGMMEIEWGEFPQFIPDAGLVNDLKYLDNFGLLNKTGKVYSEMGPEYEKDGRKFVQVPVKKSQSLFSNNKTYFSGDAIWLEVSPIKWFVNERRRRLISKNILL